MMRGLRAKRISSRVRPLLFAQPECEADGEPNWKARCGVDALHSVNRFALEAGSKVVLGFPIFLVIQVVDGKVEVDAVMDRFRDAEVHDVKTAGLLRRISSV